MEREEEAYLGVSSLIDLDSGVYEGLRRTGLDLRYPMLFSKGSYV